MSSMRRPTLRLAGDEAGMAAAAEYVLLLGVSLLIFTAIFIGASSFGNTASADATAEAAYRVAAHVSRCVSDATESGASVTRDIDLPERICGQSYVVFPSSDGKAICVLIGRDIYRAPLIVPGTAKVEGSMISVPPVHRIDYDAHSKTLTLE